MSRLVIYTVITGQYEPLLPPHLYNSEADHVCLCDLPIPEVWPWEIRIVERECEDAARESRRLKILSHRFFDAQHVLYHDANIRLRAVNPLSWLRGHDMALCAHPYTDCLYEGAEACIEDAKGDPDEIRAQIARYRAEGYPEHAGLAAGTIIMRRQTEAIKRFNEAWWHEVLTESVRDQVSFNYVCRKLGMEYDLIPGKLYGNEAFEYTFPSFHLPPREEIWL
jgi:hypothetical protein